VPKEISKEGMRMVKGYLAAQGQIWRGKDENS
jgi:hypothetical protein